MAKRILQTSTWVKLWFNCGVQFRVPRQSSRCAKHFLTHVTFVRFLSTVNSTVTGQVSRLRESFVTDSAFKRLVSRVTSSVYHQRLIVLITLAAFDTLVSTAVNVHMWPQVIARWKMLLAFRTRVQLSFRCQPFTTCCTQIHWYWFITILISFNLYLRTANPCTYTTWWIYTNIFEGLRERTEYINNNSEFL